MRMRSEMIRYFLPVIFSVTENIADQLEVQSFRTAVSTIGPVTTNSFRYPFHRPATPLLYFIQMRFRPQEQRFVTRSGRGHEAFVEMVFGDDFILRRRFYDRCQPFFVEEID